MKFLLLICVDPELAGRVESSPDDWAEATTCTGVRVEGHEIVAPSAALTVRVRDGQPQRTDGPFAVTQEFIAGFDILECGSVEEAVAVAARHPVARFGAVEVRAYAEEK